jgi:hypothetical protein
VSEPAELRQQKIFNLSKYKPVANLSQRLIRLRRKLSYASILLYVNNISVPPPYSFCWADSRH